MIKPKFIQNAVKSSRPLVWLGVSHVFVRYWSESKTQEIGQWHVAVST